MAANELFRQDSYLTACTTTVTRVCGNEVCVDQTVFYPLGGGQPGDTGVARWDGTAWLSLGSGGLDKRVLALAVHGAWALTLPGPVDWDPAAALEAARALVRGVGPDGLR